MQEGTYFPKVRRMLLCFSPWNLYTFGQLPRCFAGTLLLPLCLLLRPILKFWSVGASLMRFAWVKITEWRILVSNFSVTCNSFREFYTLDWFLHVWALPQDRLRRLHVLKDATPLPCIGWLAPNRSVFQLMRGITLGNRSPRSAVTFVTVDNRLPCSIVQVILLQHGYCTFVTILFGSFTRLFINLTMCIRALFSKSATALGLVEQAFWRVPLHRMNWCKFLWGNPCMAIETFYHWDSFLWDFGFSTLFSHSAAWKNLETDSAVSFLHAYLYRDGNYICLL